MLVVYERPTRAYAMTAGAGRGSPTIREQEIRERSFERATRIHENGKAVTSCRNVLQKNRLCSTLAEPFHSQPNTRTKT